MPLAYEVVAPGGHRAFVLGSIHVARADASGLHPVVREAFRRSPLLVMEVDLSALEPAGFSQLMLEVGSLPEGESLHGRLSSETWELLSRHCEHGGCVLEELDHLKPWLVALELVGGALHAEGFEAEHGVESRLLASRDAKEIVGLESPREQFELFDQLPPEQQELMLRDALMPSPSSAAELDELVAAWRRGDGPALEAYLFGELDERPELRPFYEATFFRRNQRMARRLEEILAAHPYVFAVLGAGHLLGARGVPALLERAGYRVHQVGARPPGPESP